LNATQSKILIAAARKARGALLALDPDSIVALELWTAIEHATRAARPAIITRKIPKCTYGPHVWRDGRCLDADDARAFAESVHDHFGSGLYQVGARLDPDIVAYDPHKAEREAQRDRLSYCACGGKAEDHREDKDGNLLECSHCDGCQQFHYETAAEAA
jgi:hypothetical protein